VVKTALVQLALTVMVKVLLDAVVCSFVFDETLAVIVVTRKGYARSDEFRGIHERLLDAVRVYRVNKVLSDDTALPTIASEDQQWIAQDWMSRAVAAGLRTAATRRAESYFGKIAVSNVHNAAPANLNIAMFDTLDQARDWLQAQ